MILKLEPFSGISGDMFLGALAPLLDAESDIRDLPRRLGLPGVRVEFTDVIRATIRCRHARVLMDGHAADDAGGTHGHSHAHPHPHPHEHPHEHGHGHGGHAHAHRAYREIVHLLQHADLPPAVRDRTLSLFRRLGEAEAEMHGIPLEQVYFHEVGGEDALIDLTGAALLIERLSPEAVYAAPVCTGFGYINSAHGRLPVPAPATQRLLRGLPTYPGPVEMEMTTPTGAAILAELAPVFEMPSLIVDRDGLGAGSRDLKQPNALRVSLCRRPGAGEREEIVLLQTQVDNCSGEDLGADFLQEVLKAGALDAWLSPILMKKGRPGQMVEVLCHPNQKSTLEHLLLQRLPTLGVRAFEGSRQVLPRSEEIVHTAYGRIRVKRHHLPDGGFRDFPEYESCREAAAAAGCAVREVREAALRACSGRESA